MLLGDGERFLSFEDFPWFKDATVSEILKVELPTPHHLYWPDLDLDLAVESIDHPEKYPLVSRVPLRTDQRQQSAAGASRL